MSKNDKKAGILLIIVGIITFIASLNAYTISIVCLSPLSFLLAVILWQKTRSALHIITVAMNGMTLLRFVYILAIVNLTSIAGSQRVLEYYIPEGYSGWVSITYDIESAQSIEIKKGLISEVHIIVIQKTGLLMTSSNFSDIGIHRARYYWYSDNTTRQFKERVVSEGEVKVRIHCESGNSARKKFYVFDRLVSLNDPATQHACESGRF